MGLPMINQGPVLLRIADGVAHLRLNRPDASNGMNVELLKALGDAIMVCHGEPDIRAVLLTGEGKNFCAGGDVHDFASKGEKLPDYLRQATAYLQNAVAGLIRLEAPVVTSVQGFAAGGGGFGLVCASDLVVAGASAKFLAGATRVGMAPDAGVSVTLPRLVGLRKATAILLTNPVISATEALELGIINRVVPDEELADVSLKLARELAAGAPKALAATKRLLWSGIGTSVEQCLPEEARTVSELSGTADAREGLAAVIERRKPTFTGR
jgi:2-(1,2-epoxy-1,2-dihydrophenyl)acetyl-CoA isomerase